MKVIGVEPFEADAMYQLARVGRRVQLDHVGIFADGVAVREVGERTFAIVQQTVDEVVRVTNDEICAAIKDVFDDTRTIMEPAGALAVAGLKTWVEREGAREPVARRAAERRQHQLRSPALRRRAGGVGEAREALIAVTLPERPGAFREVLRGDRPPDGHRVQLPAERPTQAHIFVGFATQSRQDGAALAAQLTPPATRPST